MTDVRVVVDEAAVRALGTDPQVEAMLADLGGRVAGVAAGLAPHRTGAGAASIRPDLAPGGVRVSWDGAHHYMFFQDLGTKYVTAKHFLERALDYAHL